MFLERCRQQRLADDPGLLPVRGDKEHERLRRPVVAASSSAGRGSMRAPTLQVADPGQLVAHVAVDEECRRSA
jgi:hypothetical protein